MGTQMTYQNPLQRTLLVRCEVALIHVVPVLERLIQLRRQLGSPLLLKVLFTRRQRIGVNRMHEATARGVNGPWGCVSIAALPLSVPHRWTFGAPSIPQDHKGSPSAPAASTSPQSRSRQWDQHRLQAQPHKHKHHTRRLSPLCHDETSMLHSTATDAPPRPLA
jgi:hypothetical protein